MSMVYDSGTPTDAYAQARHDMLDLIERRGVTDEAVLRAMDAVRRHDYVPAAMLRLAYDDRPLPIGQGQTISQPYMVAFMTAAAAVKPGDKVLEVGTGSGYQAAIFAAMGTQVFSLEIVPALAKHARLRLTELGVTGVRIRVADGALGWAEEAPFVAIVVTAAPQRVPAALLEQLADGARLVIPVSLKDGEQELQIWHRQGARLQMEHMFGVRFVPMTGIAQRLEMGR